MKEKRPVIITDTGDVEYVPTERPGKHAYYVKDWPKDSPLPRGRPFEKDWLGAFRWLVVKVSKEGGLPQGHGAKAKVEKWVRDWFTDRNLDAPESLVRDHVAWIFKEMEKAEEEGR